MLGQQKLFIELAGVESKISHDDLVKASSRSRVRRTEGTGDIFFRDDLMLYVVSGGPEDQFVLDEFGRPIRIHDRNNDVIEVGVIGEDKDHSSDVLKEFEIDFKEAVLKCLDGRRTRHMEFNWEPASSGESRLRQSLTSGGSSASFQPAAITDKEASGAIALADPEVKDFAVIISEAIFLRHQDALDKRAKKQIDLDTVIEKLKVNELISTEHLLECRKRGVRLTRFASADDIKDKKVGSLTCATCGSKYSDELLTEGYSLSPLGRSLIQKSHWMTLWVTRLLGELGIPYDNIIWNVSDSGEEVDIIVDFLGQIWIFELKDREFGSGDAHPFNYRRAKYGANQAIIITTDKVSKDAKRVFSDLSRDDPYRRPVQIIYIEGLSEAPAALRKLISEAALRYARQRLASLGELEGYNVDLVLRAKYGSHQEAP